MRNLASVQMIEEIKPIEGANKIEYCRVMGWWVVVKKGEFKVGDKCVYVEIDSILPEHADFEFLRARKFRIKTIKLRGCLSQGIAFPLKIYGKDFSNCSVGKDVTDDLNIQKYETPDEKEVVQRVPKTKFEKIVDKIKYKYFPFIFQKTSYKWPEWIPHTDETRIQSCGKILDELRGVTCYVAVKMDGQSFTAYVSRKNTPMRKLFRTIGIKLPNGWILHVCSRNMDVSNNKGSAFIRNAIQHDLENKLALFDGRYAIQGEQCGEKIQANRMGCPSLSLFVFNIFDRLMGEFVDLPTMQRLCKEMGLTTVPIIDDNFVIDESVTVDSLLEMAKGNYDNGHKREGIVIRPVVGRYSQILKGRASFKAINNEYLLEEKD